MSVDVLHRYRRQVSALPHSRAEMGHHQRVGTELIEEVAIDRHAVDAQDVGEHLGEDALDADRRGAAPILDQHRFSHCLTHTRSWTSTAASEPCAKCSSHGLLEDVGQALLLPARDRQVVHPRAEREVENPHAERRENDRTTTIHCRHPIMISAGRRANANAVPPKNPRQKRRIRSPASIEGKFYIDTLVTSTRYALHGAKRYVPRRPARPGTGAPQRGGSQLGIRRSS